MGDPTADLGELWRWFARHQFHGDSPIYERIAVAVANDREILDVLRQAPPAAHLPLASRQRVRCSSTASITHSATSTAADPTPTPPACSSICAGVTGPS